LYLSPACIFAALGVAAYRGELKEIFEYSPQEATAIQEKELGGGKDVSKSPKAARRSTRGKNDSANENDTIPDSVEHRSGPAASAGKRGL
jgi:hypothetical protein